MTHQVVPKPPDHQIGRVLGEQQDLGVQTFTHQALTQPPDHQPGHVLGEQQDLEVQDVTHQAVTQPPCQQPDTNQQGHVLGEPAEQAIVSNPRHGVTCPSLTDKDVLDPGVEEQQKTICIGSDHATQKVFYKTSNAEHSHSHRVLKGSAQHGSSLGDYQDSGGVQHRSSHGFCLASGDVQQIASHDVFQYGGADMFSRERSQLLLVY